MNKLIDAISGMSAGKKILLGVAVVAATLLIYALTIYFGFRHHPYFISADRINCWAILMSVASFLSLAAMYWFVGRWVPQASPSAETPAFTPPRAVHVGGVLLALFGIAICLPATFRAVEHPREVMIHWHDEGITLELVHAYIVGEKDVPHYRFTQGWVTFMPVALPLKALNAIVPVNFALTNIAMRSYQLAVNFGIFYFTFLLIWQIARSWWLATAVVVIAYSRLEYFNISLAIDRPDTFQLLFVLLSLLYLHRFWVEGHSRQWFLAVFFAAFAFASKYSGHLLTPVLLIAWVGHWRRPEVQAAFATRWGYWISATTCFAFSIGLIFPFTFFVMSPYHLIRLQEVLHFFQTHLYIYKSGNVFNLPDFEKPSHIVMWWDTFTSRYAFDYWLTILGAAGALAAALKNAVTRSKEPRALGEWLLLAWGAIYIPFLVYQYGLVGYRYIMPVQYVLPFFMLLPFLWLQEIKVLERIPYRTAFGVGVLVLMSYLCRQRVQGTRDYLADFRSEKSAQPSFDIGRHLDRIVPVGENPKILMTNLAYIPPRFTNLMIHNVDITPAFMDKHRFDYVIITDNMSAIYADKTTAGFEQQFCPLYKVYFVDVVDTYTKFKHHTHPDYRHVASFQDYHLFERIHREEADSRQSSSK